MFKTSLYTYCFVSFCKNSVTRTKHQNSLIPSRCRAPLFRNSFFNRVDFLCNQLLADIIPSESSLKRRLSITFTKLKAFLISTECALGRRIVPSVVHILVVRESLKDDVVFVHSVCSFVVILFLYSLLYIMFLYVGYRSFVFYLGL